ncbi:MAG: tetratricopeptide repeat protein [bacterium]|nr:tetratricopeptide repeat protein [bacterium]
MKNRIINLVTALFVCMAPAIAQGPSVEVHIDDQSEVLLTVRAKNASIRQLLPAIAAELSEATSREVNVIGLDKLAREANVTVFLTQRPWKDSLRWISGSAGLNVVASASRIQIKEDVSDFPKPSELLTRSLFAHRQILTSFPESPRVPQLLLDQGKIAYQLGPAFHTTAIGSFTTIIEDHSDGPSLWEAHYRLGGVYLAMGEWNKAALQFQEVADSAISHGYHIPARKDLARSLCGAGNLAPDAVIREEYGTKAKFTLEALDRFHPAEDLAEQRERAVLLGTALSLTSEPIRALRALDLAIEKKPASANDPEILTIRAVALSRAERHGESSTAWLAVSQQMIGSDHEDALVNAAEEALKGDHALAVMGIYAMAKEEGIGSRIAPFNLEAKLRLGIATELEGYTLAQRLRRAMQLHSRREHALAVEAMRPLFVRRSEFKPSEQLRLTLAFAKSLDKENLTKDAIETLRVQATESELALDKRAIYMLAAHIHESHENFPAAIEALKGNL